MNESNMTHDKLAAIGARWLRKHQRNILVPNCSIIITDMYTVHRGRPDVIGFNSYDSVLLEVKVSRADFLADKDKMLRKEPHREVGELRYYLCPEGLISPDEVPYGWGLLYYVEGERELDIVVVAEKYDKPNLKGERAMLVSLLRRAKVTGNKNIKT